MPKWSSADPVIIGLYKSKLDIILNTTSMPVDNEICMHNHECVIEDMYDIINCCIKAAIGVIPFTKPLDSKSAARIPEWKLTIDTLKNETLYWQCTWCEINKPNNGYVANMRSIARKKYHKQIKFM